MKLTVYVSLISIGIIIGLLGNRFFPNNPVDLVVTEEIHLRIPKDRDEIKKQLLHVSAQKAMLEEWIKFEETHKPKPKGK